MKNKILELAEKRRKQSILAERIGANISYTKNTKDNEIRFYNIRKDMLSEKVKHNLSFLDIYQFAYEHYDKTKENLLNEPIDEEHTLLWSSGVLANLLNSIKMNIDQYSCFVKIDAREASAYPSRG